MHPLRSTLLFFCIVQTAAQKPWQQPTRSPCSYKSEVKGVLKWNFTMAVRNHLRTLHSRLKRRVFQWCHFASRRWAVSTQTALYPAGPTLHAEWILLYLFTHFHLDKRCHCEEWETEPASCFYSSLMRSKLNPRFFLPFIRTYAAANILKCTQMLVSKPDRPATSPVRRYLRNCCLPQCCPLYHLRVRYRIIIKFKKLLSFLFKNFHIGYGMGSIQLFLLECVCAHNGRKGRLYGRTDLWLSSIRAWPFIEQTNNSLRKWKQSDRLFTQPDISSKRSQLNVSKHVARALPFSLLSRNDIYLQIRAADPCARLHELMYKYDEKCCFFDVLCMCLCTFC